MNITIKPFALPVTLKVYRRTYKQVGNIHESILWTLIDNHLYSVPSDGHFLTERICNVVNGYIAQYFPAYTRVFDDRITINADLYIEGSYDKYFSCIYLRAPK